MEDLEDRRTEEQKTKVISLLKNNKKMKVGGQKNRGTQGNKTDIVAKNRERVKDGTWRAAEQGQRKTRYRCKRTMQNEGWRTWRTEEQGNRGK